MGGCKKFSFHQKVGIFISSLLIFVIAFLIYVNLVVNPIILQICEAEINSLSQKALGSAIYDVVSSSDVYSSLFKIEKDTEGNITFISTDAMQISLLSRTLSRLSQSNLDAIGTRGISIPIGTFSGFPALSGRGPSISVSVNPIGAISSKFESKFTTAGVNQTLHRIYVNISALVNVVLPTVNQKIEVSSQVLVCENLIVGKVPDAYLNSDNLDEMMNLIPQN